MPAGAAQHPRGGGGASNLTRNIPSPIPSASFNPSASLRPSSVPVPAPTRFHFTESHRPTHNFAPFIHPTLNFEHSHRPTRETEFTQRPTTATAQPTSQPTINFWAGAQGETIAMCSGVVIMGICLVLAWRLSRQHFIETRNKKELQEKREINHGRRSGARSETSVLSAASPFMDNYPEEHSRLEASLLQGEVSEAMGVGAEKPMPLMVTNSAFEIKTALFCLLMVARSSFVIYGLLAYWARINFDGADQSGDDVLEAVDVQVYSATFWINVKQFWQSDAKTMACLIFFSGIVQPIFQMMAVIAIAFVPLTPTVRHRMISLQELTCKIPLSAFYVEAILLIVFSFDVTAETQPILGVKYAAAGTVVVTGCNGLVIFLVGQLSFLMIVNQLRLEHRRQLKGSLSFDLNYSPVQFSTTRRVIIFLVALLLGTSTIYSLQYNFIHFQYSGVIGGYISRSGSHVQDNLVTLPLDLFDIVTWLVYDLIPVGFAWFYSIWAIIILVINPLLLALLSIIVTTVARVKDRRGILECIELIQCWSGGEAIVIASLVLVPNIELITKFVFDTSDMCVEVDNYKGEECLLVSGAFETDIVGLCLYWFFAVVLVRLCVYSLHASYEPSTQETLQTQRTSDLRNPLMTANLIF